MQHQVHRAILQRNQPRTLGCLTAYGINIGPGWLCANEAYTDTYGRFCEMAGSPFVLLYLQVTFSQTANYRKQISRSSISIFVRYLLYYLYLVGGVQYWIYMGHCFRCFFASRNCWPLSPKPRTPDRVHIFLAFFHHQFCRI